MIAVRLDLTGASTCQVEVATTLNLNGSDAGVWEREKRQVILQLRSYATIP